MITNDKLGERRPHDLFARREQCTKSSQSNEYPRGNNNYNHDGFKSPSNPNFSWPSMFFHPDDRGRNNWSRTSDSYGGGNNSYGTFSNGIYNRHGIHNWMNDVEPGSPWKVHWQEREYINWSPAERGRDGSQRDGVYDGRRIHSRPEGYMMTGALGMSLLQR
jgi:hypothetical protein